MINNTNNIETLSQTNSSIQRYHIINHLISKYNFQKYLEIGIFNGYTFNKVNCNLKHGVEPGIEGVTISQVTHRMTSDDFFDICDEKYDIILIDGLHEYKQVVKDFNNSLKHISDNGYILLHDCNPVDELSQKVPRESISWNGDVWKAFYLIKQVNNHAFVYNTDFGIGVIKNDRLLSQVTNTECDLNWDFFQKNRHSLLNLQQISNLVNI